MTDNHAIQDVLSQYVRATDERDGDAQARLFADFIERLKEISS